MNSRYRTKAYVGLGLWLCLVVIFGLLVAMQSKGMVGARRTNELLVVALVADLIAIMACYFWAGSNLAKAKGYSGAIVLIGILGPIAQIGVLGGLLVMKDRHSSGSMRHKSRRQPSSRGSKTEFIVRCRRNAFVGILCGLFGIALGILLFVFRWGLFVDHQNEVILGTFVFLCGYFSVITGCWWWIKAKHWIDAVVIIGLLPLAVMFIPFVRVLFFTSLLAPFSMIMMPLILLVVTAVLPDKSGWAERKRWQVREQRVASTPPPTHLEKP